MAEKKKPDVGVHMSLVPANSGSGPLGCSSFFPKKFMV
jgi:hypothetical protein